MLSLRLLLPFLLTAVVAWADSYTVVVLRFQNASSYPELNWVGESIAETLRGDLSQTNQIVIERGACLDGMKRLGLRYDANLTKASIIHLAQSLEADIAIFGSYNAKLPAGVSKLKEGNIEISAQFIDLRKLSAGPGVSEAGKLSDLSRYKEHLAWETLKYLQPQTQVPFEQFSAAHRPARLEAEESYIHGLMATDAEHRQKWFLQAANLDPQFISPAYELGNLYLDRKDGRQALKWLQRVPPGDPRYTDARFRMGLSAYQSADYGGAISYFRELLRSMPLNEIYNNLAAAEDQLNIPSTIDDYRKAVEGDPSDTTYLFNLGAALLRRNLFDEAKQKLTAVLDHVPDDPETEDLLARAEAGDVSPPNAKPLVPARLKLAMDSTAFRQLKAILQPQAK